MTDTSITVTTDTGNQVEIFLNQIDAATSEYLNRYPNDSDTISGEYFSALLHFIYVQVFKPTAANMDIYRQNAYINGNQKSILDYSDVEGLDKIFDAYVGLCARCRQIPTILAFSTMTGIDKDTISTWASGRARGNNAAQMRTVKGWLNLCESALAQRAIMSNSIGSIFALKCNYQWRETAPAEPTALTQQPHETAEQIMERYRDIEKPELPVFDEED